MKMRIKKTVVLLSFVGLAVSSEESVAGGLCSDMDVLNTTGCYLILVPIFIVGGMFAIGDGIAGGVRSAISAVVPATDVSVELPSGEVLPGHITYKGLYGKQLVDGQPLKLTCDSTPAGIYTTDGHCRLTFPKLAPVPGSLNYYQQIGEQPALDLGMNAQGVPDTSILTLPRPLRCDQKQCQ